MKTALRYSAIATISLVCSCAFVVNGPDSGPQPNVPGNNAPTPRNPISIAGCFPIDDNTNKWFYTESGGNRAAMYVTDTIIDDGIAYYRVSFREQRVDTTDDWFKGSAGGLYFSQSLTGLYTLFLPAKIDSSNGSFNAGAGRAGFTYYDSLSINETIFHRVLAVRYTTPLLHGFEEITFADSIGIVELKDDSGRWPVSYELDSCSVFGAIKRF